MGGVHSMGHRVQQTTLKVMSNSTGNAIACCQAYATCFDFLVLLRCRLVQRSNVNLKRHTEYKKRNIVCPETQL